MSQLAALDEILRTRIADLAPKAMVAGYVGGVYHAGEQVTQAWGSANLRTGIPMTPDTGWLLGSVTKVLVTSAILRLVERGLVDLDRPAVDYVPEFRLAEPGAAERILVRHLLNHTNGIDADTLMPTRDYGPGAVASYVSLLARCGTLFEPGTFSHYSNPGFTVAGRIIERITGLPFNHAFEREIYQPAGMTSSSTSAEQAMLRRTAIGAFLGQTPGELRPTETFMLPVSGAAAGATPIVTVADLIAFGRIHLNGGVAPNGTRVLSAESVRAMATPSFDLGTPNCPAVGLGWRLVPMGGVMVLWHGGGSPGGISSLAVVPELDLVVVSFATGPGGATVQDHVLETVLQELFGRVIATPYEPGAASADLSPYEGAYGSFQSRLDIRAVDGGLEMTTSYPWFDDDHRDFLLAYMGGSVDAPPTRLVPLRPGLFAIAGPPLEMWRGIWGRMALASFHRPGPDGRFQFIHQRWRAARRIDPAL